jgi:hypothetical protein
MEHDPFTDGLNIIFYSYVKLPECTYFKDFSRFVFMANITGYPKKCLGMTWRIKAWFLGVNTKGMGLYTMNVYRCSISSHELFFHRKYLSFGNQTWQ